MEGKNIVCFNLLGSFSYFLAEGSVENSDVGDSSLWDHASSKSLGKAGKKTVSLLQYLIVHHTRNVSADELFDVFWAESESRDPANALANMLFKVRSLLKKMFPQQAHLLRTLQGCYAWDSEVQIVLDSEAFETTCLKAGKSTGPERMELLWQAASLYQGDFLPGNDSEWAELLRQYYRNLYLDACKALLPLLEEAGQWTKIVNVCNRAYQVEFYMEDFTAYQMYAFITMGQPEQALERYEAFRQRLLNEIGLSPSERIERLCTLAHNVGTADRGDADEPFALVCEDISDNNAFFCSFEVFRNIVALEKRHLQRSGQASTLVIVSLDSSTVASTDVKRLERILKESLRIGDPVARLNAVSYILMLSGVDSEKAQIVTSRIDSGFHRAYRNSAAQLSFRMSVLHREGKYAN